MTKIKGIDVSGYQGNIDFKKVKDSGVEFVIVKIGGYDKKTVPSFETFYKDAKEAGLNVGGYWYTYAVSAEEVESDAAACIDAVKDKQFDYPIFLDLEEPNIFKRGKNVCSQIVTAFCSALENAGLFTGLYMSRYYLENYIFPEVRQKYALWIAEYSSVCRYNGDFGIWQYGTGEVSGVPAVCDLDYCYVDYPEIITKRGFNGYSSSVPDVPPQKPIKEGGEVRIKNGAKTYDGQKLAPFVYDRSYNVSELSGDRAVVVYRGVVVAAVNVRDLTAV